MTPDGHAPAPQPPVTARDSPGPGATGGAPVSPRRGAATSTPPIPHAERTAPLCKDELLRPGTYTGIRLEHLASTELSAEDKAILAFLANSLRGANVRVRATVAEISAGTAIPTRTVHRRIAHLETAGVLEVTRQRNRPNWYAFLPADYLLPAEAPARPQPARAATAAHCHGDTPGVSGWQSGSATVAARDCHGGTPLLHSRTKKRTGEPPPAPALFESDVEKRWAAAYRTALGHGMPGNWYAAIRAELASPEPDLGLLQAVTAKTVREAHALARQRKRPFGPGWVLNLLRERAVELHERQRRQQAERAARAAQQRAAAQAKERAADEEACWAALPPERQEQCRQAARGHFPRFQPAESVLEALARQLAHQAAEDAEHEA